MYLSQEWTTLVRYNRSYNIRVTRFTKCSKVDFDRHSSDRNR